MGNQRVDTEDQETLFRSSYNADALYFIESPSTASRANSHTTYHVPHHTDSLPLHLLYSSHGSDGSYLHGKRISYYDYQAENEDNRPIIHGYGYRDDDDDEWDDIEEEEEGCMRFFSFSTYPSSSLWICLQILWRLVVILGIALLVFYIATKPPPPRMSVQIAKIGEFGLREGADATGVTTKFLTINCSINLMIKNKSKFFRLGIQPAITLSFRHLPLAVSYGPNNMYARSDESTIFKLMVATRKNKPIYGGGRAMQDMLDITKGLPLVLQLNIRSSFRVVWGLISSNFHHKAECLLLLGKTYDKKNQTQVYKSRCLLVNC